MKNNNMQCLKEKQVNRKALLDIFKKNNNEIIYVLDDSSILIGIITLGDFRRNELYGDRLINKKFKKIFEDEEDEVLNTIRNNENINTVPVVNKDGKMVKQLMIKEDKKNNFFDKELFEIIYKEMEFFGKNNCIVLYCIVDEMNFEDLNTIYSNNQIKIISESDIEFIENYMIKDVEVFVYDFCKWSYNLRKIIYEKNNIKNKLIDFDYYNLYEMKKQLNKISQMFCSIMVIDDCKIITKDSYDGEIINIKSDMLLKNGEILSINEKGINENVECLICMTCMIENPCINVNNRIIPIIAIDYLDIWVRRKAKSIDIINNIIPRYEKNNIKYIIINTTLQLF